jgi:hypothetical protein
MVTDSASSSVECVDTAPTASQQTVQHANYSVLACSCVAHFWAGHCLGGAVPIWKCAGDQQQGASSRNK